MKTILETIVGSRAHGTALPESDYDYRGVFIVPAEDFISPFRNVKSNHWIQGEEDNTSYELAHFCKLCAQGNPSALELLTAPVISVTEEGERLKALLPKFIGKKRVFDAFMGYSRNQEKKFRDNHLDRRWKYAEAHIRTQYQLLHLLKTGELKIGWEDPILSELCQIKRGQWMEKDIMARIITLENMNREWFELANLPESPDIDAIEEFLFSIYLPQCHTTSPSNAGSENGENAKSSDTSKTEGTK